MKEVLQRLEMVKSAIMLEDDDVICLQVNKLSLLTLDRDASDILDLLQRGTFESVIGLIENYRQSKLGLVSYEDKELYGLRLELKMVEAEYEELCIEKITIESMLNDFNSQYYHKCGKLIEVILLHRAKLQQVRASATPEDQDKADAFAEAQNDYDDFYREYTEKTGESLVELNDADQKELKAAFRKASSLCHPDKVSDKFKEQAGEVFKQLNEAYKAKNLKLVNKILAALQSQKGFGIFSDTVSSTEKLRLRIANVREKVIIIEGAIATIKSDETYQLIESLDDWEIYFDGMNVNLKNELVKLEKMLAESSGVYS